MGIKEGTYTYTGSGGRKYHVPTERVSSLSQLQEGDHIAMERKLASYWHHAIVEDVETEKGVVNVIAYSNKKVMRCKHKLEDGLYLIKHRDDMCLSAEDVVNRARSRLRENGYDLLYNNCEHFAMWCKTAISSSEQVEDIKELTKEAAVSLVVSVAYVTGSETKKIASKALVQGIVKSEVTQTSKTPQTSKIRGAAYAAVCEGAFAAYDIYNANKDLKAGNITQEEFNDAVGERIVGGVGRVAGSSTGAVVGQLLIPVPIVGGIVGGWVGAMAGRYGGGALWGAFK